MRREPHGHGECMAENHSKSCFHMSRLFYDLREKDFHIASQSRAGSAAACFCIATASFPSRSSNAFLSLAFPPPTHHRVISFCCTVLIKTNTIIGELLLPFRHLAVDPAISRRGRLPRMATQIDPMDLGEDGEHHDQPDEVHHFQDPLEDRPSACSSPSLQVCERKEIARDFLPFSRPHDASGISRPRPVVPSQIDRLQSLEIGTDGFNASMLVSRTHRQPLERYPGPALGQHLLQPVNHATNPVSTVEPPQAGLRAQEDATAANAVVPSNTAVVHEGDSQGSLVSLSDRRI